MRNSFSPSAWMRFFFFFFKNRALAPNSWFCVCKEKKGQFHWEQIHAGSAAASPLRVWQIRNKTGPTFLRSRRKMQMNNTSFFKKLLRFSLETYFLSAQEVRLVEEICSWDCCHGYRGFFDFFGLIYIKVRFPSVSSNQSGSTTERRSDRAQSLHSSWGWILIIN